jgi:hypothetical protein
MLPLFSFPMEATEKKGLLDPANLPEINLFDCCHRRECICQTTRPRCYPGAASVWKGAEVFERRQKEREETILKVLK